MNKYNKIADINSEEKFSVSIVLPLYNEYQSLVTLFEEIEKFYYKKKFEVEFIIVNDGSNDGSLILLQKLTNEKKNKGLNIKIISYPNNQGKGFALKKGVLASTKEWILTTDVDLSVSFDQLTEWFKVHILKDKNYAYFGSRELKNSNVVGKKYRIVIGQIFNFFVRYILGNNITNIKDTQCGFKLYNRLYAKKIFNLLNEKGFVHDVEILILLYLNNIKITELPIKWIHRRGSSVNIIKDSISMFFALIKLKIKYKI